MVLRESRELVSFGISRFDSGSGRKFIKRDFLDYVMSRNINMAKKEIATDILHKVPPDLRKIINSSPAVRAAWEDITPLARNEWICWIESAKKSETRNHRIERTRIEILEGKRRPCCWAGCIHR